MDQFTYVSAAQYVIFGPGSLAGLGQAVESFGWQRLLLCTIGRLETSGLVGQVTGILGGRLVATFARVQPHVPQPQVEAALALALEHDIDAVIGLGGGSPIGLAKAVSMALEEVLTGQPARAVFPTDQPFVPVVAIPTTYAGSEMTPIYGVTRLVDGTPKKVTVRDGKVTPKIALYDPELTLDLPVELTASSGINALAHCIEALYSITRNPLSTAAALEGIRHIMQALPRVVTEGTDIGARTEMLLGAHLAAVALAKVKMGLHHGLCHVLGGSAGVPHGIANSIILPHAMRFNLDETTAELAAAAHAMDMAAENEADSAQNAVQTISELIARIGLPQRLRDVGVAELDLAYLARVAINNKAVQNNPKPITSAVQTESVLRAAW
jgi:maleylacetate reductase